MYEVNYNIRMSFLSNYFYCSIQPEGLHMIVSTVIVIAKFLV